MSNDFTTQKGFSLLETLVAFAILTIVLTAVFQIFAQGSKSSRLSYEYNQAIVIAQSKLALMSSSQKELSGIEHQKYNWHVARKPEQLDVGLSSHFRLDRITATVTWQTAKQRQVQLSTLQLVNQ